MPYLNGFVCAISFFTDHLCRTLEPISETTDWHRMAYQYSLFKSKLNMETKSIYSLHLKVSTKVQYQGQ